MDSKDSDERSEIKIYGTYTSSCGYCKQDDTSTSFGGRSQKLTCEDYQDMIDRGWRRSGTYIYKPIMNVTCCPQYTIRLEVSKFKASKNQKSVMRKINHFFAEANGTSKPTTKNKQRKKENKEIGEQELNLMNQIQQSTIRAFDLVLKSKLIPNEVFDDSTSKLNFKIKTCKNSEHGQYTCAVCFQIVSRLNKSGNETLSLDKVAGLLASHFSSDMVDVSCSHGYLNFISKAQANEKNDLNVNHTENMSTDSFNFKTDQSECQKTGKYEVLQQKPESMHMDTTQEKAMDFKNGPFEKEKFTVTIVSAEFSDEVFQLYKKYQVAVHDDEEDELTEKSFARFLVTSPLFQQGACGQIIVHSDGENDTPFHISEEMVNIPYGSYHMLYRFGARLIAVGVVDVLPYCLSSVYMFYDPDFRHLSPGKFTALKEIEWVQKASVHRTELKYYYLGYYIHSCPKMRYKGDYRPSDLLCPETFDWFPLAACLERLDNNKYCRLNPSVEANSERQERANINDFQLRVGLPTPVTIEMLTDAGQKYLEPILSEFASLISKKTATQCILCLR